MAHQFERSAERRLGSANHSHHQPLKRGATLQSRYSALLRCADVRGDGNGVSPMATMLACGSFLIVSIGVFRLDANRDATKRDSGTGGFALIGETTCQWCRI